MAGNTVGQGKGCQSQKLSGLIFNPPCGQKDLGPVLGGELELDLALKVVMDQGCKILDLCRIPILSEK